MTATRVLVMVHKKWDNFVFDNFSNNNGIYTKEATWFNFASSINCNVPVNFYLSIQQ